MKLSGDVRGGVGRRRLFFESIAISCRFVYILRRCQYLQGGCGGVVDDIDEQAMLLRNEMMRKLWRPMLLLVLAALVMPTVSASAAASTGSCATEGAVSDADDNPGLVADCEALLAGRDTLAGTGRRILRSTVGKGFTPETALNA